METNTCTPPLDSPPQLIAGVDGKIGIVAKMVEVRRRVPYLQRDAKNAFHKYNYASEAKVKEFVGNAFSDLDILFTASVVDFSERDRPKKDGGTDVVTTARIAYRFLYSGDGSSITGQFYGAGSDNLDKGLQKAITGAVKNVLTSTLLIPTGDDPDYSPEPEQRQEPAKHAEPPTSRLTPPLDSPQPAAPPISQAATEPTADKRPGEGGKKADPYVAIKKRVAGIGWDNKTALAMLIFAGVAAPEAANETVNLPVASKKLREALSLEQWDSMLTMLEQGKAVGDDTFNQLITHMTSGAKNAKDAILGGVDF